MNLESKVTVQKSAHELFDLLTDVKSYEKLMPDSIAKFEIIGKMLLFWIKRHAGNQIKMKESCTNQSST
jgi:ribosome-associated toxin RatA of RatAB toxin-antitoxin module